MKFTKFYFCYHFLLIQTAPVNALIPFSWFTFYKKEQTLSKTLKEIANKLKLAHLYNQRIELENFKKMYDAVSEPLPINQIASANSEDQKYLQEFLRTRNAFIQAFYERYPQDLYHASRIDEYAKNVFDPLLKQTAKESSTTIQELPESWYEQLKKQEAKLSAQERQKSSAERQKEFKEWQANTNFESVKKQKEFFENWYFLRVNSLRPRSLSCSELLVNSLSPFHDNTIVVTNIFHARGISCHSLVEGKYSDLNN